MDSNISAAEAMDDEGHDPTIRSPKPSLLAGGDLAPGAFPEPLFVGRPNFGDRKKLLAKIDQILDRNWLTNDGPVVREFETLVAERSGVDDAIAVTNGTIGLELVLRTLEVRGHDVVVPSFTFIASAHAAEWSGARVQFCDIDAQSHLATSTTMAAASAQADHVLLAVDLWGQPADIEASENSRGVVYDAAHAFGSVPHEGGLGARGIASVYSFHATKFVNTFEGGAVVTSDPSLAEELRLMRNFGFTGEDSVGVVGTNAKMNEICAAQGLVMLDLVDDLIEHNMSVHAEYGRGLAEVEGISLLQPTGGRRLNHQYVVAEVDETAFRCSRDDLIEHLRRHNVIARRYFFPGCHRSAAYGHRNDHPDLPITDSVSERVVLLPTGMAVDTTTARRVTELIAARAEI